MTIPEIIQAANAHADKMEKTEYTSRAQFARDAAIALELAQRYAEALAEKIESLDVDYVMMEVL